MASELEIREAAKAMVMLAKEYSCAGKPMPTRLEEAEAALRAAETVREAHSQYIADEEMPRVKEELEAQGLKVTVLWTTAL